MSWVIGGTLAYIAAIALSCRLFRHATDPEPCYVDPELAQQVKEALAAEVERQERLASTSELRAIDIDLYDPGYRWEQLPPCNDEELAEWVQQMEREMRQ